MNSQLSYKILIVDDEIDIIELLSYNLKKENFTVVAAMNGKEAIQIASKIKPDIILMDVMMPEMDGIEACRQIKAMPQLINTPLIFLTARGEEFSELAGFEAGADDYIIKPIKPRVLISRLKAILRRNSQDAPKSVAMNFTDLKIDRESFSVTYKGKVLQFPKKEFELLSLLASKPGKVFTREQILESIWGDDVLVVDRTIDVHIRKIREKLEDNYIQTIKGVGYKFEV
ncbi:MAG: response regulator transcription factor [Bacteroidota bacterium]|nr:response regulator transcription factor [Bacteroidota bacterium]